MAKSNPPNVGPVAQSLLNNSYFYVLTGLSGTIGGTANPMAMTWGIGNQEAITITGWSAGNSSQIWMFGNDGSIQPANYLGSWLTGVYPSPPPPLLTTLLPADTPAANRTWTYSNGQLSINPPSIGPQYLNVSGGQADSNTQVILYQEGGRNELWYLLPVNSVIPGIYFYIETQMPNSPGDNSSYVITIPGNSATEGTQVVIEPLVPGALNQLWMLGERGFIVSALDTNYALNTSGTTDTAITIKTGTNDYQSWYFFPNGVLGSGASGNAVYANVQGGGNAAAGKKVIVYDYETQSNALWKAIPYQPTGLWFTIEAEQPAASPPGTRSLLTLTEGAVSAQAPAGSMASGSAQAAITQLWKRTPNGLIVSAMEPGVCLTAAAGGGISVEQTVLGSDDQIWYWTEGQATAGPGYKGQIMTAQLISQGQQMALTASGTSVNLQQSGSAPAGNIQSWYMLPQAMPFGGSTTIRNIAGGTSDALFLTVPEKQSAGASQLDVCAIPGNTAFSMWQYEYPGYLVSNINPDIVMSLGVGPNATVDVPTYSGEVIASLRQPNYQLPQLWTITAGGEIVNQFTGEALSIQIPSSPGAITSAKVCTATIGDSSYYQSWDFGTGMALEITLQQPSVGFPQGSTEEQTVYNTLSKELGLPDGIRDQYQNLAAPLGSYQAQLNMILLYEIQQNITSQGGSPPSTELDAYKSVVKQLNSEITAVMAIRSLFQQVNTMYLMLGQAQSLTLSDLITMCALPNGVTFKSVPPKKKKSWIWDLGEGILYTGMNLAGSLIADPAAGSETEGLIKFVKNGLPCLANVMSCAMTTTQAYNQGDSTNLTAIHQTEQNIYNYEMSVLQLKELLLSEFVAIGPAIAGIEALILSDWGKLQAVYEMCRSHGTMSSLFWPSAMTAMDVNQMLQPYTESVLQTLMPANPDFKISATMHTNFGNLTGEGWNGGNLIENNDDGTQNVYSTNISQELMNTVWKSGANGSAFFRSANGWNVQTDYQDTVATTGADPTAAQIVVTMLNYTNQKLGVVLTLDNIIGTGQVFDGGYPTTNYTLLPFGQIQFAGGSFSSDFASGPNEGIIAYGLTGDSAGASGVTIQCGDTDVITFGIGNSYNGQTYESDVPPCTFSINDMTVTAPYNCYVTQATGNSGMVFMTVFISAL